jgi:hypothetical protein
MVLPSVVPAMLAGMWTVAFGGTPGLVGAQRADEVSGPGLPTADAGTPAPLAQEPMHAKAFEEAGAPALEDREPDLLAAVAQRAHDPALSSLPSARARRPIRSERFLAMALTSGLIVFPATTPFPLPEVGFDIGVNLGPHFMVDVCGGLALIAGGAKVFLGKGDIVPYVVARFGATPWTGPFASGGVGIEVSRSDGVYAFAEASPMLARSKLDNSEFPPAERWRTLDAHAMFGYGKRY